MDKQNTNTFNLVSRRRCFIFTEQWDLIICGQYICGGRTMKLLISNLSSFTYILGSLQNLWKISRTLGFTVPKSSGNFFLTFSVPFWHLLFRKSCSLKLSSPLSPCAPNPVMVKYVVKNRFPEIWATFRQIQEAVHSLARKSLACLRLRKIMTLAWLAWFSSS